MKLNFESKKGWKIYSMILVKLLKIFLWNLESPPLILMVSWHFIIMYNIYLIKKNYYSKNLDMRVIINALIWCLMSLTVFQSISESKTLCHIGDSYTAFFLFFFVTLTFQCDIINALICYLMSLIVFQSISESKNLRHICDSYSAFFLVFWLHWNSSVI